MTCNIISIIRSPIFSKISVISAKGFTLIEAMVTTAVLSLGIVFVYQGLFAALDSYGYYVNYLNAAPVANEKLWLAQDALERFGDSARMTGNGEFSALGRDFKWNLSSRTLPQTEDLYQVDLNITWQQGRKAARILRSAYARYENKE